MENRLVNTFLDIVKIDSPTGMEKEVGQFINAKLERIGVKTEIDQRGNIITKIEGDNKKERLFLNAHMDTVEPGKNINPIIVDGIIKSDGKTILGADNKAAVAGILETIEQIVENKISSNHPLDIVFTTYEESESLGAIELDYSKIEAKRGYVFDLSNVNVGDIIVASPFYNRLNIKLIGKSSHASNPELGKNVLPVFGKILKQINFGKISDNTFVNFGIINGGSAVNTIPGEIIVSGEIRSFIKGEIEEETLKIENIIKVECENAKISYIFEAIRENDGYYYSDENDFVLKTKKLIEELGIKPSLIKSGGCSDANIFNNKKMQILNIGDGTLNAHTLNEQISIENLNNLQKLIFHLIS